MNNNNSQFDKELHDRLSNEELPFDPMAWEMMEEKLDKQPKRRFLFWITRYRYLLGSLSIILIAAITYWSFHYNNFDDRAHSEVVSISNSKSNTTTEKNTTSESPKITVNQTAKMSTTASEKNIKSSSTSVSSTQNNSTTINKPTSTKIDNATNRKSARNNTIIEKEVPKKNENYITTKNDINKNIVDTKNIAETTTSNSVPDNIPEAVKASEKNEILNKLSTIGSIETSVFAYDRELPFNIDIVDIEEKIDRPKSQINMTVGAGMTQLDIDDPFIGDITPTAVTNQEIYFSLSYLHRLHRNWGVEIGAQATGQSHEIAHYFKAGDYDLSESEYGKGSFNAYQGKYELFSNIHFFLPLNQRSEIDIYGGFYANNPLSQAPGSGGSGRRSIHNNDLTLIRTNARQTTGSFNGGRIKLGLNYNFLTNKLNNVGIGIAYTHQVNDVTEGTYSLIQVSEEARVSGNARANPSGLKVQMTYGFGLKKFPWGKKKLRRPSPKTPWYLGMRYGTKKYVFNDDLSRDLVGANIHKAYSIYAGHYLGQRMAFEFGLDISEFNFLTPIGNRSFLVNQQFLISAPFALRYDVIQKDRISLYGKGIFTTDFRVINNPVFVNTEAGHITDEDNLRINAGIATGIDFRVFAGVTLGIVGKYNHAFSRAALVQFPELTAQNEIEFRDINLRNTYFSWGIELKYQFNRYKKG